MTHDLQQIHASLTAERAKHAAILAAIDLALADLQPLVPAAVVAPAPVAAAAGPARAPKVKPRRAEPGRLSVAKAARGRGRDKTVTDEAILDAIRRAQPVAPKVLAGSLGLEVSGLRRRLDVLVAAGTVAITGSTVKRRVSLVGAAAAPGPASAPAAAAPADDTPDAVQKRDAALLERLRDGKATFEQLVAAMPDTHLDEDTKRALCRKALRRLSLRGQVVDVGTYFKSMPQAS